MGMDVIFSLIAVTASLALAWRSYSSHRVPFEKTAMMAVAWVIIIGGLVFILSRLGFGG